MKFVSFFNNYIFLLYFFKIFKTFKTLGDRYNERLYGSPATAGSQFDYVHDNEDSNFQLVDSNKPQKQQKLFRRPFQFVILKFF